jgi:hypothetical protein
MTVTADTKFDPAILFTSYNSGVIRDSKGKLAAHWDEATGVLVVDGYVQDFYAGDLELALDIVNALYGKVLPANPPTTAG